MEMVVVVAAAAAAAAVVVVVVVATVCVNVICFSVGVPGRCNLR